MLSHKVRRPSSELSSEEARDFCFTVAASLAIDERTCEVIISLNGDDPKAALKYLAEMHTGARRIAKLQQANLLRLFALSKYFPNDFARGIDGLARRVDGRDRRIRAPRRINRSEFAAAVDEAVFRAVTEVISNDLVCCIDARQLSAVT